MAITNPNDQARRNALKRRKEILEELEEINQFLALYERFTGRSEGTNSETVNNLAVARDLLTGEFRATKRKRRRRGRPADFAGLMERIIRDEGRPMNRSELAAAVEDTGVSIPSQDKPRYLGTILWRHRDRFVNLPGKGYYLPELMSDEEKAILEIQRDTAHWLGVDAAKEDAD